MKQKKEQDYLFICLFVYLFICCFLILPARLENFDVGILFGSLKEIVSMTLIDE